MLIIVILALAACRPTARTVVETVEVTRLVKETVVETVVIVDTRCLKDCYDALVVKLEGELPETLVIKTTGLDGDSVALYCAADDGAEKQLYHLEYLSSDDARLAVIPPAACTTSATTRAAAYLRADGSTDRLFLFCSDTPEEHSPSGWTQGQCLFDASGAIHSIEFAGYMPCQATFTLYLPDRAVSKTVIPDYKENECETGVTINLED